MTTAEKVLPACPVETTLTLISSKWKVLILRDLLTGTKRFGELHRSLGGVSQKVLTAQLREMEDSGLLTRTVYPEVPPPGGVRPDGAGGEPAAHPGRHVGLGHGVPGRQQSPGGAGMRRLAALACALALALTGCGGPPAEDDALHVLATTYPVYLFTTAVTEGAEGVEVDLLVNQPTSCLHDYTLTVTDMKAVQRADVIVMNGAGLEDFLDSALAASEAETVDCSAGLDLLPAQGHEGHHHDTLYDPHIWMDPSYAAQMVEAIVQGLSALDGGGADLFRLNGDLARQTLAGAAADWAGRLENRRGSSIITFHDGFQYFAAFLGLDIYKAIEEEEGATASARELK